MSDLRRQDRINLHKRKSGIKTVEPSINEMVEGVPEIRTFFNQATGKQDVVQYVKSGSKIMKSQFSDVGNDVDNYSAKWYLSDEIDIGSTGTTRAIIVPAGTYLMDVRIINTEAVTAGSMNVDVGISTNIDVFIDGWDGSAGSHGGNTINAFGRGSSATETGVKLGKYFDSTDHIRVTVHTAATSGKIKLMAWLITNPPIST